MGAYWREGYIRVWRSMNKKTVVQGSGAWYCECRMIIGVDSCSF